MALNTSGPISLGGTTAGESIAIELGESGTAQISLNDTDVRDLAGVASGAITMPGDFYGASSQFAFTFSAGANQSLYTLAIAAGWDASSKVVATCPVGGNITSGSTGSYAFIIQGAFPGGVEFISNSPIRGRGGNGGNGGAYNAGGQPGGGGGPALLVGVPATIQNNASIVSGGGGGGGGNGVQYYARGPRRSGGGGGGGGVGVSSGGAGGTAGSSGTVSPGQPGTAGTLTTAGTGGRGGVAPQSNGQPGANGGAGGSSGGSVSGSGGTAGTAVQGYSLVQFTTVGTITGPTAG